MEHKLGLTTEDFQNPAKGINLQGFTNLGLTQKEFTAKYGNGKYSILTKGQLEDLAKTSQEASAELIQKGEDTMLKQVSLKVERVLVNLEKGGQSEVFCIERPSIPKADNLTKAEDSNLEGNGDDLQKAILDSYGSDKIKFTKTGKEIKEKLVSVKAAIATKVAEVSQQLAVLQVAIGFDPTSLANEWWYRSGYQAAVGTYLCYDDDKCYYSSGDNYNEMNGSVNGNLTQDTCNKCRQYNRTISNLIDLKCDSAECDTYINNMVDTEKYVLSTNELVKLGF